MSKEISTSFSDREAMLLIFGVVLILSPDWLIFPLPLSQPMYLALSEATSIVSAKEVGIFEIGTSAY